MLSAPAAISAMRRSMQFGLVVRIVLLVSALACLVAAMFSWGGFDGRLALAVVVGLWIALSIRSWHSTRLNAGVPMLLASGEYDEAERQIDRSIRSFSLFGPVKLVALHQLAVLRMAQGRFGDAGALCRELLGHRMARLGGLSRSSRMMLAQAALEEGNASDASAPLASLRSERLSLAESMGLLQLELDYQSRSGQWAQMLEGFMPKVQLAEVMPSGASARVQALLALSALKAGREDVADWLRERAALLESPRELVARRPLLGELFPEARSDSEEADPAPPPQDS